MKNLSFILFLVSVFAISILSQSDMEAVLEDVTISAIDEEQDYVWVATYGQGIYRYSKKDGKWFNFSSKNKNLENDLFYNLAVGKDFVWAGASEGLFIYDKKRNQWRKRKFAQGGEFGNWIRALKYDKAENTLWIGRFRNLTQLDVARQRFTDFDLTKNNDAKTNNFISIGLDGDSLIWFGTEGGVHIYKKKKMIGEDTWGFISNEKGFKEEGESVSISDFVFEPGNIWFGTDEFVTSQQPGFNLGGIYKFNRKFNWEKISKQNGLPANGIYCLEKTGNKIWAAVYSFDRKDKKEYGKGLVLIDRLTGKVTPIDLNQTKINSSTILSLYFDGKNMWIGTDNGLYKVQIANPMAVWGGKKETTKQKTTQKK